jgi:hypothetical protein
MVTDAHLLQAALLGYQAERERIDQAITEIRKRIGKSAGGEDATAPSTKRGAGGRHRSMSTEARERIAAAQRKRWAQWHKQKSK